MMKITCFCVIVVIARTLADSVAIGKDCCSPGFYVSKKNQTCYLPDRSDPSSIRPLLLKCKSSFDFVSDNNFLYREGKFFMLEANKSIDIGDTEFCFGTIRNKDGTISRKVVLLCIEKKEIEEAVEFYAYFMLVSVVFLTATVIIYSAFRNLRDLYGKSFINLCGSLAIALLLLAVIRLTGPDYSDINICVTKGLFTYFFLMASFLWTTAISIQIFRSFRCASAVVESGWKPFIWYALFAWGFSSVLTMIAAIVHHIPGDHAKPFNRLAAHHCWFYAEQIYYYIFSVLGVVIVINISIYCYTFFLLWRYTFASTRAQELKSKFWIALRLFTVMGIVWTFQFFSILDYKSRVIWDIINCITDLQGLWIFLFLVVFRRRVVREMYKHGWLPSCTSGLVEGWLAKGEETDEVIEHTAVPLNDHTPKKINSTD